MFEDKGTPLGGTNPTTNKKDFKRTGDINASHKRQELEEILKEKAECIQTREKAANSIPKEEYSEEKLSALEKGFKSLVKDTNILIQEAQKKSYIRSRTYDQQFKASCTLLGTAGIKIANTNYLEKRFNEIKPVLDNTAVIIAYPHQVTLFKIGAIYRCYAQKRMAPTLANILIASMKEEIPDRCKRVEIQIDLKSTSKTRPATLLETGEKCFLEAAIDPNQESVEAFNKSCLNFLSAIEISETPADAALEERFFTLSLASKAPLKGSLVDKYHEDIPDNLFPPIPVSIEDETKQITLNDLRIRQKSLNTIYEKITQTDLLERLIPQREGYPTFQIPTLGGVEVTSYMQSCLSTTRQIPREKTREARDEFIVKFRRLAQRADKEMDSEKAGDVFEPSRGFVSYNADPNTIVEEVLSLKKKYDEKTLAKIECNYVEKELKDAFFNHAARCIKNTYDMKIKSIEESYARKKKAKEDIIRIKIERHESKIAADNSYQSDKKILNHFEGLLSDGLEGRKLYAPSLEENRSNREAVSWFILEKKIPRDGLENHQEKSIESSSSPKNRFKNTLFATQLGTNDSESENEEETLNCVEKQKAN